MLKQELERQAGNTITLDQLVSTIQDDQATKDHTTSAKVGRWLLAFYPVTKLALDIAGTAASSAGFAPVQIAASGLSQVFELLGQPSQNTEKVKIGLTSFARDQRFLQEVQDLSHSTIDESLLICATEIQAALTTFICSSIRWMHKSFLTKLAVSVLESDVDEASKKLLSARDALTQTLLGQTYLTVNRMEMRMRSEAVLSKLCSDDYHVHHLDRPGKLHAERAPNSGLWILRENEYAQFSRGDVQALWLPGLPGAGKTFIASVIADDLDAQARHRNIGVACVYCQYQRYVSSQQTLSSILSAMIRQLAAPRKDLIDVLGRSLAASPASTERHTKDLIRVTAEYEATFVIVDALDEFSGNPRDRYVKSLSHAPLQRQSPVFRRIKVLNCANSLANTLQPLSRRSAPRCWEASTWFPHVSYFKREPRRMAHPADLQSRKHPDTCARK